MLKALAFQSLSLLTLFNHSDLANQSAASKLLG